MPLRREGLRSAACGERARARSGGVRHDLVVRDNAAVILALASLGSGDEAADVAADDGLAREDRVLIEQYLARRASLDVKAALAIATVIAARIRPKLRASFHYLDDVSLIEHIARSRR